MRVNSFTPLDTSIISSSLYRLEHLTEIDILSSFNTLDNDSVIMIFKGIANRKDLKKLRLDL